MAEAWTPAPVQPEPQGRGAITTGVVLLVVGVVLAIVGIVGVASTAVSLLSGLGSPQSTPAQLQRTFSEGTTYAVYEKATSGRGTPSDPYRGEIAPGEITVQALDGSAVIVTDSPQLTQTFSDGSQTYIVVATFDPPATGSYVVTVKTQGATIIVAPAVTAVAKALPWVTAIGLGGLLAVAGLVVLIVGLVRRSSSRKALAPGYAAPAGLAPGYGGPGYPATGYAPPSGPAALPPPGWYPDPERPGGRRYWSGTGWTENRA